MTGFTNTEANKMAADVERLQAENAELKAHIERWANEDLSIYGVKAKHANHQYGDGSNSGTCTICDAVWPCPTEVVKGWKE